jgi:hypothetical protein
MENLWISFKWTKCMSRLVDGDVMAFRKESSETTQFSLILGLWFVEDADFSIRALQFGKM